MLNRALMPQRSLGRYLDFEAADTKTVSVGFGTGECTERIHASDETQAAMQMISELVGTGRHSMSEITLKCGTRLSLSDLENARLVLRALCASTQRRTRNGSDRPCCTFGLISGKIATFTSYVAKVLRAQD